MYIGTHHRNFNPDLSQPPVAKGLTTGWKIKGSHWGQHTGHCLLQELVAQLKEAWYSMIIFCHNSLKKSTCPMQCLNMMINVNSWFFTRPSIWPLFRLMVVGSRKAMLQWIWTSFNCILWKSSKISSLKVLDMAYFESTWCCKLQHVNLTILSGLQNSLTVRQLKT